ncbi:TPA: PIG-L deacetylase family protein [Escherichia coli]
MTGVLVIGAHPDDIELGCGATLAKLYRKNIKLFGIVITQGSEGCAGDSHVRVEETRQALATLGVEKVFCLSFQDRQVYQKVSQVIDSIESIIAQISKEHVSIQRVYIHCPEDRHQDHRAVFDASVVACRDISEVFCYETPSSRMHFVPNYWEELKDIHLMQKIESLKKHESQKERYYMQPESVRTVALFRGEQVGCQYCEAFYIYKMIMAGKE